MLGTRFQRRPWERRLIDLGMTRHLCLRFQQLTMRAGQTAPDPVLRSTPTAAQATEETERGRRELQVGKNRQRLSKVLAQWGIASRRKAEEIIAEGRVTVNGESVTVPQTVVRYKSDKIVVDGKKMKHKPLKPFYFVVNKPAGYLCTSAAMDADGNRKKIVLDLFEDWTQEWKQKNPKGAIAPRLFTVGRLDKESRGLIFVTNDGHWAQQISHPSSGLTKEYVVHTSPEAKMSDIREIGKGCEVDGKFVEPIGVAKDTEFLRVVVAEGRNREVRTLVENAGLLVTSLKRVRIGGYRMPSALKVGKFRVLQAHERRGLMNPGALNGTRKEKGRKGAA